jgi:hypothetical protein
VLVALQTIGVIVAVLVSAYAVAASEMDRRRSHQRARVERVLDAVLALVQTAIETQQGAPAVDIARRRLRAELSVVNLPLTSTELMTRFDDPTSIMNQSEAAIIELAETLDNLAPRPLLRELWRRA